MRWDDQYKINIDVIDDQHHEWFARVAAFGEAINKEHMIEEIARTLKFAVDYSLKHLSDEERYMREINYPKIDRQIELHNEFKQKIVGVLSDIKKGKRVIPSQLHDFMTNWIRQHIINHDMQIGEYQTALRNKNDPETKPPQEIQDDPLIKKLNELSSMLKSKLITQEDYTTTTSEVLTQYVSVTAPNGGSSALEIFEKLTALQGRGLISDENTETARALLSENINLDHALEPYHTPKTKLNALKTLLNNKLITDEQYDEHKSIILSGI